MPTALVTAPLFVGVFRGAALSVAGAGSVASNSRSFIFCLNIVYANPDQLGMGVKRG